MAGNKRFKRAIISLTELMSNRVDEFIHHDGIDRPLRPFALSLLVNFFVARLNKNRDVRLEESKLIYV